MDPDPFRYSVTFEDPEPFIFIGFEAKKNRDLLKFDFSVYKIPVICYYLFFILRKNGKRHMYSFYLFIYSQIRRQLYRYRNFFGAGAEDFLTGSATLAIKTYPGIPKGGRMGIILPGPPGPTMGGSWGPATSSYRIFLCRC